MKTVLVLVAISGLINAVALHHHLISHRRDITSEVLARAEGTSLEHPDDVDWERGRMNAGRQDELDQKGLAPRDCPTCGEPLYDCDCDGQEER